MHVLPFSFGVRDSKEKKSPNVPILMALIAQNVLHKATAYEPQDPRGSQHWWKQKVTAELKEGAGCWSQVQKS